MSFDGILLIDKPADFTSFDVIAKLRGMAKTKKAGHGGTLDPMATGVLPVFFGGATKCCSLLPEDSKRYSARFKLGAETDTLDITGRVVRERPVTVTPEEVRQVAESFLGESEQLPPMYSAVQVDGRRLYDLARQNIEVERHPRSVVISELTLTHLGGDEYAMEVDCSSGTYIRSLASDIGEKLGCGAVLTFLRRTRAAGFPIEDCITLSEAQRLTDEDRLSERLLPADSLYRECPRYTLNMSDAKLHLNGVRIWTSRLPGLPDTDGWIRIYREDGQFLSISHINRAERQLQAKAFFCGRQ